MVKAPFSTAAKTPAPGNIIEYRITYTNIATATGVGSVSLTASGLVINENGASGSNNWAAFTTHQLGTVVSPVTPLQFFNGATLLGTSDPATGTTVTRYVNSPGTVNPGSTGTFTFQRKVN
ncbi:hypothetical protein [Neosynechococcus sphagnicola]|uniref:hypothetical protein n=1 Tax=Neosynechococcus sphagnicola TaxID=1501145 RepID=UPI00068A66BE|nr:hypothetical protein [Neosynechococcus sphagnicola]